MAKKSKSGGGRNAGDKARAAGTTSGQGSGSPGGGWREVVDGKTLIQMQAQTLAEQKFIDMMAAAGVHTDRMALEVMYWLPDSFLDLYQELYMRGLRGTDGGTGDRGKAADETGALGKAPRKTTGSGGKKFKKYWVVADEQALDLKSKIDKRLRALTRDVRDQLVELDFHRARGDKESAQAVVGVNRKRKIRTCADCGIIVALLWNYCPKCGCNLMAAADAEGKVRVRGKMKVEPNQNREAG